MYPRTVTPSEWCLCLGDGVAGNHAVKDCSGCARRYGADGVFDCFVLQRPRHAPQHRIARSWGMANARPSVPHSYTPDRAALERLRTALAAYDDATGCT